MYENSVSVRYFFNDLVLKLSLQNKITLPEVLLCELLKLFILIDIFFK